MKKKKSKPNFFVSIIAIIFIELLISSIIGSILNLTHYPYSNIADILLKHIKIISAWVVYSVFFLEPIITLISEHFFNKRDKVSNTIIINISVR